MNTQSLLVPDDVIVRRIMIIVLFFNSVAREALIHLTADMVLYNKDVASRLSTHHDSHKFPADGVGNQNSVMVNIGGQCNIFSSLLSP